MKTTNHYCTPGWLATCGLALIIAVATVWFAPALAADVAAQRGFASPRQAVDALAAAVASDSTVAVLAILGPGADDLVISGDEVADRNGRARFLAAYAQQCRLEQQGRDRTLLIVGARDYPFPIPIVRRGEAWFFDAESGRDEILSRRIGRNELHTIEVMHTYTDAQREFACLKRNDGKAEFARKFASSPGEQDGLYWEAGEGEAASPFGPLIARATEEGYRGGLDEVPPEPFHGYYFKILTAQGEHANGGAFDYVAGERMVLGFALVAYPAKYGASGIMTFIVNQADVIYEKDLGESTAAEAVAMTRFDPDASWRRHASVSP